MNLKKLFSPNLFTECSFFKYLCENFIFSMPCSYGALVDYLVSHHFYDS